MNAAPHADGARATDTVFLPCSRAMADETMPDISAQPRWYAIYTRSRHEKSAADMLDRKQVETFLPLYETVRRWKNGDHRIGLPLFPSYAFVRIALRDRLEVLKVPGVVRLVGFNGLPIALDDGEVENLRQALFAGVKVAPHPYLTVGRRVRVTAGPLAGREGILVRRKGAVRVVLSIDLIQRSVMVDVNADSLEPAGCGSRTHVSQTLGDTAMPGC